MNCKLVAKIVCLALAACAVTTLARGGAMTEPGVTVYQNVEPDYYLTFSPALPMPGQEVVVSLAAKSGLPAIESIRWNLSGAPVVSSGAKGAQYAFTPSGQGSYLVQADFRDPQGVSVSSTLEIVIGGSMTSQMPGEIPLDAEMNLGVSPAQPRIGQLVTFTFRYAKGIPNDGEVRWNVSGGAVADKNITGKNKESCSFTPTGQTAYYVEATLHDGRGALLGEVNLGFIPIP